MSDCFVHASDLHLDAPLGSLGRLDENRQDELAALAINAWNNLVDLCIAEQASFLVLAGDIFDKAAAGVGVQSRFRMGLRRLAEEDVRGFICHGNHDPLSDSFKPIGDLPPGVVRFQPGDPQSHVVTLRHSGDAVRVSGVSFGTMHETENLALRFRQLPPHPDAPTAPHVAVLHANVGRNPGHDPYAPCSYEDLDGAGVDYWALGHIHKRHVRRLPRGGWAAYCGNLQGRSFKASECEPKGALVVPVDQGQIGEPRFEPRDEVRFVQQTVELYGDSITDAQEKILDKAEEVGIEHAPRPVVLEIRLAGRSSDAERLTKAADDGDLYNELSDELSSRLNGGGLCAVNPAVRAYGDRDAIMAADDLRADVLSELQSLRPSAAPTGTSGGDTRARLHELLDDGLPPTLREPWQQVSRDPTRLNDVLDRAEQLLLAIYADAEAEASS